MNPNSRRLLQIGIDFICLLSVGMVPLTAKLGGFNTYHRGFFCDDESLKHPLLRGTIPFEVVAVVACFLPLLIMIFIETILYKQGYSPGYEPLAVGKITINSCVVTITTRFCVFMFGLGITQTFTDVTKYSIGRLRPHFFAVCQPDYSLFNCSSGYITGDVCTGTDAKKLSDSRLSFLSGHTSVAAYTGLYIALYLQARMVWSFSRLLKHILQSLVVLMAWLTALSRISDYKHHAEDVIMGAVLGLGVCITVILLLSDLPPPVMSRAVQYQPQRKISQASKNSVQNDGSVLQGRDAELGQTQCTHT